MEKRACIFNIQKFSLHDGPGIRTVIFFKGCPLRCFWCANPESQNGAPECMWDTQKQQSCTVGSYQTIEEMIHEVMKDAPFYEESGGGVTLSGGEVLFQADIAVKLLQRLKEKGLHTACETTGFGSTTAFDALLSQVDLLYFDVKHYDSTKHKQGTGVSNTQILKNLAYAVKKNIPLIVRVPIIPDFNDTPADAEKFAQLFLSMGIKKIELLPFHQFGEKKYDYLNREYSLKGIPQLHTEDLDYFKTIMENHALSCHIQ